MLFCASLCNFVSILDTEAKSFAFSSYLRYPAVLMARIPKNRGIKKLEFGGRWTEVKLDVLEKYLGAYTRIFATNLKARHFQTIYVDAFAGTGRISYLPNEQEDLFEHSRQEYVKGSATRALEVSPEFNRYIFIESNAARCAELNGLKSQFPEKERRIEIRNDDANQFLQEWCTKADWSTCRAVVLLDSFAMDVSWETIEALAKTKGIDLWWLFPSSAFNRLLTTGAKPPATWAKALTRACGTPDWIRFYEARKQDGLFGPIETEEKISGFDEINSFLRKRLESVFVRVAPPLYLKNSSNTPLFMLFFAASNEKGAATGTKIANWIIKNSGS